MMVSAWSAESTAIELETISDPKTINVGLESFCNDLRDQEIECVQVDWRPPAGGNEELISILEKMRT